MGRGASAPIDCHIFVCLASQPVGVVSLPAAVIDLANALPKRKVVNFMVHEYTPHGLLDRILLHTVFVMLPRQIDLLVWIN